MALAIGEVNGFVGRFAGGEGVDARDDSADAVIDVSEVQHFLTAEDDDGFAADDLFDEERDDAFHAREVVVVAAVDVAETKDKGCEVIATSVAGEEGFAGDFAGGVGGFGDDEVGHGFVGDVAEDIAVDLAAGAEEDGGFGGAGEFECPADHVDVFEGFFGFFDELVDFGPCGEVDDHVGGEGIEETGQIGFLRKGLGEVEDFGGDGVGPGVGAFIDANDMVAALKEGECEVRADLSGGTGDEDFHGGDFTRKNNVWRRSGCV